MIRINRLKCRSIMFDRQGNICILKYIVYKHAYIYIVSFFMWQKDSKDIERKVMYKFCKTNFVTRFGALDSERVKASVVETQMLL